MPTPKEMSGLNRYQSLPCNRDIILILHRDGSIMDANDTAIAAYGYSLPELKALTIDNLTADRHEAQAWYNTETTYKTSHRRKNGSIFEVEISSHYLNTTPALIITIIRDITPKRQLEVSLQQELATMKHTQKELLARNFTLKKLASTDNLTGLWNRLHFHNTALCELERAKRYHLPLSLILFDIDYFKHFNDSYGHQTGDDILITIAKLIQEQLRTNDTFARFGGDEFIILLPNTAAAAALQTAEKIRGIIESCKASPAEKITLSMGVAEYIADETIADWIKRADDALYLAKRSGRNCVKNFD
jgi:diguanylate cyclase (GGDEF)-like protein/PAS domain S-box-containing protein